MSLCGILPVDKPAGWTSFDVIAKLRGVLSTRRLGHSGTLDPMATGVLPVFVGMAAKAVDLQPDQDKAYRAQVRFGLATDTGDITGAPVATGENIPSAAAVKTALAAFLGPRMQTPPMYSAVKVGGVPLYKLARQGKTVERAARPVTFYRLALVEQPAPDRFVIDIECSKGTYVRTLVEELGQALGCPACLAALRRTRAGAFTLDRCVTLEAIRAAKEAGRMETLLLGVDTLFSHLPAARLAEAEKARLLNGAPARRPELADGRWRLYDEGPDGAFLGLGIAAEGLLRGEKLFVERV